MYAAWCGPCNNQGFTRGIAVGDGGLVFATEDTGRTWRPRASGVTANLMDVQMNGDEGWIVGYGGSILAVLLVGADIGSRILTQRVIARRIQASLHLSDRPSVSLDGFPFLLHFAEGSFPAASARGSGLR